MKRLIFLLISGITALPMLAQLNGDGFYRIQNTSKYGRYLTISNNKVDDANKDAITSGREGNVFGLKTITNPVSDPSSIIYISKDNTGKSDYAYNIQAQGINPLAFLKNNGAELKIYPNGNGYFIYGSKGSITLYLVDNNGSEGYIKVAGKNIYPDCQTWKISPIDQTNEYLGIAPDENIKIGDKYYTTIYVGFPFDLPEGMKAYYVCNNDIGTGVDRAELKEITGTIPAKTPVILECSSLNPADNKLSLLASGPKALTDNKLSGVFFCYVMMKVTDPTKENTNANFVSIKNAVEYNPKTMRVLGLVDGKLGLVTASDDQLVVTDKGKYLPANKAYFTFSGTASNQILLLDKDNYEEIGKWISYEDAIYKKDEDDKGVILMNGKNLSGSYDIPETITQPDGTTYTVTAIAAEAVKDNENLTEISIPSTVTSIGENAFAGCKNLKEIHVYGESPIALNESSIFEGVDFDTCILIVPDGCLDKYENDVIWGLFKNIYTVSVFNSVNSILIDEKTTDIYNLKGQKVSKQENLPNGIYIIDKKKVIKK